MVMVASHEHGMVYRSVETYVKMGSHLGVTAMQGCSSEAIPQALPGNVQQEADTYSTAKRENFRRLAVIQMEAQKPQGDGAAEKPASKWDVVRASVTLRNKEFLATLLQHDSLNPGDCGEYVELATQQTVLVEEEDS